ncbi:MAG: RIP metalloprotease RseP, partial [Pseudomonadales bacterium]|nr:RIP metalloprotease RseP [Pseudomonadales bacterium]
MSWLVYVFAILAAFFILVTIHELGHYLVARRSGVAVLRFSIGLGRPIYKLVDKNGTEWTLGWIPIGGYVKMLDEREFEVPPDMRAQTFNAASPPRRIAIAAAGPVANLVLSLAVFWLILVSGTSYPVANLDAPSQGSAAWEAGFAGGERIVEVDGDATPSWYDVNLALAARLGETGSIEITVQHHGHQAMRSIPIQSWLQGTRDADLTRELGLVPALAPVVDEVVEGSAAELAGLRSGDRISFIDGSEVHSWSELASRIAASPGSGMAIEVVRSGTSVSTVLTPTSVEGSDGALRGFAGISVAMQEHSVRLGALAAVPAAMDKTLDAIALTVGVVRKMITGNVSVDNLAGPVTVAQVAGQAMQVGWIPFLSLLAFLSISLGSI